jgi:hypothetical protein
MLVGGHRHVVASLQVAPIPKHRFKVLEYYLYRFFRCPVGKVCFPQAYVGLHRMGQSVHPGGRCNMRRKPQHQLRVHHRKRRNYQR